MKRFVILLAFFYLFSLSAYAQQYIKVLIPKSLEKSFSEISEAFYNKHNIKIKYESNCSGKAAKLIHDYGKIIDVVVSADYSVIDNVLVAKGFADWNIKFAKNEMVLGFRSDSKYAKNIDKANWYKILLKPDVNVGLSAATNEPCGYRSLMVLKLAELFYGLNGFTKQIVDKALFERKSDLDIVKDLLSKKVDYIIAYKTYANEYGFKYLELPKEINLFSARYGDYYKQVKVEDFYGLGLKSIPANCIFYSVTIPHTTQKRELAVKFVHFLLSNEVASILEKHGFFVLCEPEVTGNVDKLDKVLKSDVKYCIKF
ncbi:conserved hypothetical protein [Deferribacter desulfuricans SSM1]|uniref:Molybdate ABC transporter, substrate-binding protein n=1 Tax=Deferribacter desulfuricans (strain DSM 14783 / JCM 11476 / NBRC 101012 / SSM1) TaxID=639282 RepID=D3P8W2_DEFDS|nr:extracellular solute-binding protein [Deferribacter desulfuricans]BAI81152.1 conserved hypothetical protein [Deferribacter desulfuricans SSM1]